MSWRAALERFLRGRLPSADDVTVAAVHALPRGASNTTLAVDVAVLCDGFRFVLPCVLRLQRGEGLLAPYDVLREHRVLRALARAAMPVPPVLWCTSGIDGLGSPFFLMLRVEGRSLPSFWYPGPGPDVYAIAEALASIHSLDWRTCGLDFLAPPGVADPLAADLAVWEPKLRARGLEGHAFFLALRDRLMRDQPADARLRLVHGDPNPGNFILRGDRVIAIVDWELAALADPRADLGFYAALQTVFLAPPPLPGETSLSQAYRAVTGEPLSELGYYEAVGLYKLAIVMAGSGGWGGFFAAREAIERRLAELLGPRWAT